MLDLIQSFRHLLGRKEYDKLDDVWLELVESEANAEELLGLVELTERYAPAGKAGDSLWVLADALKERGRHEEEMEVLKRLSRLTTEEARLAGELTACYRSLYGGAPDFEKLLQKSGLGFGRPLRPAMETTERYVRLLPGSWLYSPDWGACRVEKLDFLLDRVTVRCAGLAEYTVSLDSAHRRFRPVRRGGYFHQLAENRPGLERLAAADPGELVVRFLRDTGQPTGVKELKQALSELVPDDRWDGFWNQARKTLDRHPHVAIRTRPSRAYQWSSERVKAKEGVRGQGPAVRDSEIDTRKSTIEDPEVLVGMPEQEVMKAYGALSSFTQRRRLLEALVQARPGDWPGFAPRLFVVGKDNRVRDWLESELARSAPEARRETLNLVQTGYREHPDAFLWLAGNAARLVPESMPAVLTRLIDLLELPAQRKRWSALQKALAAGDWALVRAALESAEEAQARSLLARLDRLPGLEPYQKDEIRKVFADRFPGLVEPAESDFILSTAAGIERARQELRRLTEEDIPRSAEEIGRARAHGDLSENYEYKAAKEKQARLMARVGKLRAELSRARPIEAAKIAIERISVGCRVELEDPAGGRLEYAILGPWDSDPEHGIISYLAPLGQRLIGMKPGESVEIEGSLFAVRSISPAQ